MLDFFSDKECCNCIKLFLCILWDSIVLGLVLSWWRIKHEMKISAVSRLARKFLRKGSRGKATREVHVGSWSVKCRATFREHFVRYAISRSTRETLCLKDFKCDFLTPHPYYIYPHYPQKYMRGHSERKTLNRFSTTHTPIF